MIAIAAALRKISDRGELTALSRMINIMIAMQGHAEGEKTANEMNIGYCAADRSRRTVQRCSRIIECSGRDV